MLSCVAHAGQRPKRQRQFDRRTAIAMRGAGYSLRAISKELGIPMRTIYDCVVGIDYQRGLLEKRGPQGGAND